VPLEAQGNGTIMIMVLLCHAAVYL